MHAISITIHFWMTVIFRGAEDLIHKIRDDLMRSCVYIIALVIISVLATLGILKSDIADPLFKNVKDEIEVITVFVVVIASMLLIVNIAYVPAKIYEEIGGFLKTPVKIIPNPQLGRVYKEEWASLIVENMTTFEITDCTLTLQDAINLDCGKSILRSPEKLTWSGREQYQNTPGDEPKTIIGKGNRVCDVAHTQSELNRSKFTLWFGLPQHIEIGEYKLLIVTNGKWQDKGFRDLQEFKLIYRGEYDLSIEYFREENTG